MKEKIIEYFYYFFFVIGNTIDRYYFSLITWENPETPTT